MSTARDNAPASRIASAQTCTALEQIEAIATALTAFWDHDPEALEMDECAIQDMAEWLQTMPEPLREMVVQQVARDRRRHGQHDTLVMFGRRFEGRVA